MADYTEFGYLTPSEQNLLRAAELAQTGMTKAEIYETLSREGYFISLGFVDEEWDEMDLDEIKGYINPRFETRKNAEKPIALMAQKGNTDARAIYSALYNQGYAADDLGLGFDAIEEIVNRATRQRADKTDKQSLPAGRALYSRNPDEKRIFTRAKRLAEEGATKHEIYQTLCEERFFLSVGFVTEVWPELDINDLLSYAGDITEEEEQRQRDATNALVENNCSDKTGEQPPTTLMDVDTTSFRR